MSQKSGISGALLWPAAGLVLSVPVLILQSPSPEFLLANLRIIRAPIDVWGGQDLMSELRSYLLQIFYVIYLILLVGTPILTVLFFWRSRLTKRLMSAWLILGILLVVIPWFDPMSRYLELYWLVKAMPTGTIDFVQAMLMHLPSVLFIPAVKVFLFPHHLLALVGWLVYFHLSKRVANTFAR